MLIAILMNNTNFTACCSPSSSATTLHLPPLPFIFHVYLYDVLQTNRRSKRKWTENTNLNKINVSMKLIQNKMKWNEMIGQKETKRERNKWKWNKRTCVFFVIYLYLLLYTYNLYKNILYSSEYYLMKWERKWKWEKQEQQPQETRTERCEREWKCGRNLLWGQLLCTQMRRQ